MITCKVHTKGNDLIVAACDSELLGKTLTAKNGAEIFINPSFYNGEEILADKLLEALKEATIANLFGRETIDAAKELNLKIINIDEVPHSQIFKIL